VPVAQKEHFGFDKPASWGDW